MFWFLFSFVLFGALFLYAHRFKHWQRKGVQQQFPWTPLGDNVDTLVKGYPMKYMVQKIYCRFQNVRYSGYYFFHNPVLMLRDPELIRELCIKNFEHFCDHKPFQSKYADPLWNKCVLVLKGEKWKNMRTTLSPAFTSSKMKKMFVVMQQCAEKFANHFLQNDHEIQEVDLTDSFPRYAIDIIANTAIGIECDSLKEPKNDVYLMARQTNDFSGLLKKTLIVMANVVPLLGKIFKYSHFDKYTAIFFKGILEDVLYYRRKNNAERPDVFNLLIHGMGEPHEKEELEKNGQIEHHMEHEHQNENERNITFEDAAAQVLIFFSGGTGSVSNTLYFMASELATNNGIQERLIEELDRFRATNDALTYESLAKLTYLDMVVCETLRKWPHFVMTDRNCVKPYTIKPRCPLEKSVELLKGDSILIPIYALHHDPQYWQDPEVFDPERFSLENKEKIIPCTYLPFGVGPRMCIAARFAVMEIKLLFYEILTKFEIVPIGKDCNSETPRVLSTLRFKDGFRYGLKKRNLTN